MTQSEVFPPGTPTLSGIVAELTPAGPVPLSGVNVWRRVTTGARITTTDKDGLYSIPGLIDATDTFFVSKEGYQSHSQNLTMNGDTRFDVQLVRR
ncbi:MAG: carboxypeptidase regulatory-like domain-containing protein [Acidobacteria bacterium]|nr:carboxypeptidase regulatory-like domain-containing protein [Acidobacteriota bacterium]